MGGNVIVCLLKVTECLGDVRWINRERGVLGTRKMTTVVKQKRSYIVTLLGHTSEEWNRRIITRKFRRYRRYRNKEKLVFIDKSPDET